MVCEDLETHMDQSPHAAFSSPMGSPSWSIAGSSEPPFPDPIATDVAGDSPFRASTAPHPRNRKGEKVRARAWVVMESGGWSGIEEFGKHAIMKRVGLPARDLRILDPMLSYPSTILGRERAIVVKLEHIKAIITANEVLVLKSFDPHVELFLRELQLRLASGSKTASEAVQETDQMDMGDVNTRSNSSSLNYVGLEQSTYQYGNTIIPDVKDDSARPSPTSETSKVASPKALPFEFRALEICLECTCRCLENETSTLVQEAHPALDELTSKISTLNLERVRQIKSRLVTISGRVQKVRDELEQLLDDDMDMAEMYLTYKLNQQELEEREARDGNDDSEIESDYECEQISMDKTKGSSESGGAVSLVTVELEMLLEAYFVQIEGTLNKLSALREYVDDTEDYINIMLDDKQNQLLQMGVILSTATLLSSAGIAVVGMFGMNIHIGLYDAAPIKFWETSIGTVVTCTVLFITAITWGRWKGLLSL